ncbi:MAG: hypothetical protein K6G26_06640, partial [Lachnospiraceae bacterium]|nr:hypothetical protein [Lachnospiraceae bacterium]
SVDELGNADAANYYKFGYIDPETKEEVIIKESSLENNAEFKAVKAGKYNLFVYIYKLNNSFERKYIYNYVVEQPEITWFLNDIYSPQRKGTKINFEVRTTKLSPECSVKVFAKDSDGNEEVLKQDGENNYVWVPSKIDKYTIVAQILYGTEVIDERIISDYKIITDDTRFKILDITMNNKDIAVGDYAYVGIEFDGGQMPYNYEVGYKYDNKEQYLLTSDAYSTYNSVYLTAPEYDGKVTIYVKAHDANGTYSYKEFEYNVHRFKINGIKYEPEGKILEGETVRLSVDTEYERTYKVPNIRKYTITNLSTNETEYLSSYGYTTEWTPSKAGKYRVQVDITSFKSGSDTYTTELKVYKNNNDGLYIDSVIPSIDSPAKLGDSIYFTIDRVNEVENVDNYAVYKIVNIETNETVTATEYVYNDGGRFVWTPDKAGKYNIMVEFFAGNESAGYSLDYEVVENVAKNTVTIYYKGFSTPYIHYAINNAWTNAPGIAMTATSEMEGYTHKAVIELPENETKLVACFNDGNNHWDSANGKNYTFGLGEYTYSNGKIRRVGEYKDITTIYYKGFENPYIHYSINGKWTNLPGIPMTRTNIVSGYTHEINIEMDNADEVVVCFNDGKGNWDSRNGQNYTFGVGTYYYSNGKITAK